MGHIPPACHSLPGVKFYRINGSWRNLACAISVDIRQGIAEGGCCSGWGRTYWFPQEFGKVWENLCLGICCTDLKVTLALAVWQDPMWFFIEPYFDSTHPLFSLFIIFIHSTQRQWMSTLPGGWSTHCDSQHRITVSLEGQNKSNFKHAQYETCSLFSTLYTWSLFDFY